MIKKYCWQRLNSIEVLIFKALTDSYTSHDEFVLVSNVSKEYDDMKEEIHQLINTFNIVIKQCYHIA